MLRDKTAILVACYGEGGGRVCSSLSSVCLNQGLSLPLSDLPVPHRPWSDISLDFVTGLPPFKGNTTILTVVDRFSKMVHFIPLPKLPSAKERCVFRLHGFPKDVVSDQEPQFAI